MGVLAVLRFIAYVLVAPILLMPVVWPLFAGALCLSAVMLVVVTLGRRHSRHQGYERALPFANAQGRLIACVFLLPVTLCYVFIVAVFAVVMIAGLAFVE
jgi:hypothetical protein